MLRSFYFRIMWLCDDCGKLFGRRRPIRKHTKTTQLHLGSCQMFYWVKIKKKKENESLDQVEWHTKYVVNKVNCNYLDSLSFQCNINHTAESYRVHVYSHHSFFFVSIFLFPVSFFQPPPLQAPQQTAAPSHANHCNSCYRLPCFPLVRSRLLVTSWTIRMGRFKKGGSKPACKLKLSSGELKFITDHTSFTEDHIKEWHKVNRLYINKEGGPYISQNVKTFNILKT